MKRRFTCFTKYQSGTTFAFAGIILFLTSLYYLWSQSQSSHNVTSMPSFPSLSNPNEHAASGGSVCIPGGLPENKKELSKLYDGVDTFLMFIGYPRSSHSLVGALLDAHPQIIIPHEYHIIEKWDIYRDDVLKNSGMQKYLLFYNLHSMSTWQATFGSRAKDPAFLDDGIYSYNVPGAWQGSFNGKIKVIGDKKGGGTTMELTERPEKFKILKEINETVGIPLKFLHVIRNPFDVISTWVLRLFNKRLQANDGETKLNKPGALDGAIKSFFELIETNERILYEYGDAVLNVMSHDLISKPKETMKRICFFLSVTCDDNYLAQTEKILFARPSHTRKTVAWSQNQKERVHNEMQKYSYLSSFKFEE